jgi:hypothetical protein
MPSMPQTPSPDKVSRSLLSPFGLYKLIYQSPTSGSSFSNHHRSFSISSYDITIPASQKPSSPPPAYINNRLNDSTSNTDIYLEIPMSVPGPGCSAATPVESKQNRTVSKLEDVIQSLEKEDEQLSLEDKLISYLGNIICRIGDANISGGKRNTEKPIKFKDAVGRRFSFPYYRCETWAVSTSPNSFWIWY